MKRISSNIQHLSSIIYHPSSNTQHPASSSQQPIMEVFNVAYGQATTLFQLFEALRNKLAQYDPEIAKIEVKIGPKREGDIPHSLASVEKIKAVLNYEPKFNAEEGFKAACEWYYGHLG